MYPQITQRDVEENTDKQRRFMLNVFFLFLICVNLRNLRIHLCISLRTSVFSVVKILLEVLTWLKNCVRLMW